MNKIRTFWMLAVALLAMAASVPALAHGGYYGRGYYGHPRVSVGFVFGGPGYWGYPAYYYPPPYYYPYYPGGVSAPAPTYYIERGDAYAPPEQSPGYWYYCPEAKAYHPYVKQCAGGWQRVSPTPPPSGG